MAYDNLCKYLAEQYPDQFAAWLLGQPLPAVEVLKTELSSEPIRADSVTLLHGAGLILHLEFQVEMKSKPPLPFRMLDYWVRLYRRYELPVKQVLVMLKQTEAEVPEEFRAAQTWHRYQVVRMWEQEPGPLLQAEALLPLAVLAQGESPARLLEQVAERVSKIEPQERRRELSSCAQVLAGLRYEKGLIQRIFKEGVMKESVIYQEIVEEGRQEGLRQGIQEGLQQGIQQGIQQERGLILRLLNRRVGPLDAATQERLKSLSISQWEALGEALLDFAVPADLTRWLDQQAPGAPPA